MILARTHLGEVDELEVAALHHGLVGLVGGHAEDGELVVQGAHLALEQLPMVAGLQRVRRVHGVCVSWFVVVVFAVVVENVVVVVVMVVVVVVDDVAVCDQTDLNRVIGQAAFGGSPVRTTAR